MRALLAACARQDLLHPDPDAATIYLRQLERRGLAPTTIQARLAAARGLYAGLRWCRVAPGDPFAECRAPRDTTPAWEKRMPYADDEVAALLQAAPTPPTGCWCCWAPTPGCGRRNAPTCAGRTCIWPGGTCWCAGARVASSGWWP